MNFFALVLSLTISVTTFADVISGITVPTEPNSKINKTTIAGIDSDKNGIRDDIDRMIATYYGKDKKFFQAISYYAIHFQNYLLNPSEKSFLVIDCRKYILDAVLNMHVDTLQKRTLDTPERNKAFLNNNQKLLLAKVTPIRESDDDICERPSFAMPILFNYKVPVGYTAKIKGIDIPEAPEQKLNDSTLEGVDKNSDGVRDDVERAIAFNFSQKEIEYEASMENARAIQSYLHKPSKAAHFRYLRSRICFKDKKLTRLVGKVQKIVANTDARKEAIGKIDGLIVNEDVCPHDSSLGTTIVVEDNEINIKDLPPEPNAKINDSNVEGIDFNKNGIRDDIERKITLTFANDRATYDGLIFYAKYQQRFLLKPDKEALFVLSCAELILDPKLLGYVHDLSTFKTPLRAKEYNNNVNLIKENKDLKFPKVVEEEDCERPYFAKQILFRSKVPIEFSTQINGVPIPPAADPKLVDASVEGVDQNKNGVRDDVERLLAFNFEKRKREYVSLFEFAKLYQTFLLNPNPANESNYFKVFNCLKEGDLPVIATKLMKVFENTDSRKQAAMKSTKKNFKVPNEPCYLQY